MGEEALAEAAAAEEDLEAEGSVEEIETTTEAAEEAMEMTTMEAGRPTSRLAPAIGGAPPRAVETPTLPGGTPATSVTLPSPMMEAAGVAEVSEVDGEEAEEEEDLEVAVVETEEDSVVAAVETEEASVAGAEVDSAATVEAEMEETWEGAQCAEAVEATDQDPTRFLDTLRFPSSPPGSRKTIWHQLFEHIFASTKHRRHHHHPSFPQMIQL